MKYWLLFHPVHYWIDKTMKSAQIEAARTWLWPGTRTSIFTVWTVKVLQSKQLRNLYSDAVYRWVQKICMNRWVPQKNEELGNLPLSLKIIKLCPCFQNTELIIMNDIEIFNFLNLIVKPYLESVSVRNLCISSDSSIALTPVTSSM